jgi:DNA-binding NtrC family response regulator
MEDERKPPGREKPRATILLVDDEPSIIQIMEGALRFYGYRVFVASKGKEAVEVYRENWENISVVVLDRTLPDVPGEAVLESLAAVNPGLKMIFTSGYSMDPEIQALLAQGGHVFLPKPFGIKELIQTIQVVCGRGMNMKADDHGGLSDRPAGTREK